MKKLLIALVILPALLLAACAPTQPMVIPMPGSNIAQLQPELLVREAAAFLGVAPDELRAPTLHTLVITNDFQWKDLNMIFFSFVQEGRRDQAFYYSFLHADPQHAQFSVQPPERLEPWRQIGATLHRLQDYLDAVRYLPQQHLLDMVYPPADTFWLSIGFEEVEDRPEVFYNRYGVIEQLNGEYIMFSLRPMFAVEGSDGNRHEGTAYDAIHLFFELG
ncbi:MAG: hypothetical protein FWB76_03685 [Oscillospiraceae bacterium]|nr:hypothetical protein [Oscillospiraceae bacterium]